MLCITYTYKDSVCVQLSMTHHALHNKNSIYIKDIKLIFFRKHCFSFNMQGCIKTTNVSDQTVSRQYDSCMVAASCYSEIMMPSLYCKWEKLFHTLIQTSIYITSKLYACGNVQSLPPTGKITKAICLTNQINN